MKVFPRRLTDDEYVDRLRRSEAWRHRWRWWLVAFNAVLLAGYLAMWVAITSYLLRMLDEIDVEGAMAAFWVGGCTGLLFGLMLSVQALSAAHGLVQSLRGFRSERLLVRHYRPRHRDRSAH